MWTAKKELIGALGAAFYERSECIKSMLISQSSQLQGIERPYPGCCAH
jgi:hypothetical protein